MNTKAYWGIALLTAAILLMAGLAVLPYAWVATQGSTLADKRNELRFMEARLKNTKNGPKNRLTAADDVGPLFVGGSTPGLSIAQMQSIASQLAVASGLAVESLQPLQTDRDGELALLRMEAQVSGSIESLRQFLVSIETAVPVIFINQMKIDAAQSIGGDEAVLPSEQLTVTLQLEGFGWWGTPQ